jgi:DNA-binding response OmpR family regulator
MSSALLLAEEPGPRGYLERYLRRDGFDVVGAERGGEVLELAERASPDLVLLAARFANGDGLDLCGRLRAGEPGRSWNRDVPVILLGEEHADAAARVRALQLGADDYLPRPYDYAELVERIRAVLRRAKPLSPRVLEADEIRVDIRARLVTVNGERVPLSAKEYALLVRLAAEPDRVFTKIELLHAIWGINPKKVKTKTVEAHASRLRTKLASHARREYVVNEWGVGYRLLESRPPTPLAEVIELDGRRVDN